MCAKTLMQRQKDLLVILENLCPLVLKWVRMGGKIKIYEGCFAKVKNLLLNRK
jgi:hypothetical protein